MLLPTVCHGQLFTRSWKPTAWLAWLHFVI